MNRNRCSLCRSREHTYRLCPRRPDAVARIEVPLEHAEQVLRDRLRPIIRASTWAPNLLEAVALSSYLQGAMDALTPEFQARRVVGEER